MIKTSETEFRTLICPQSRASLINTHCIGTDCAAFIKTETFYHCGMQTVQESEPQPEIPNKIEIKSILGNTHLTISEFLWITKYLKSPNKADTLEDIEMKRTLITRFAN